MPEAKTIKVLVQVDGVTMLEVDVRTEHADQMREDVQEAVGKLLRQGNGTPPG